jgi:hypothetical protein
MGRKISNLPVTESFTDTSITTSPDINNTIIHPMDHLPSTRISRLRPVKVPFICSRDSLCGKDEFQNFPKTQGWELEQSESLTQLAGRAQAWLFFGLLAVARISPDACIDGTTSSGPSERSVDTSATLSLLDNDTSSHGMHFEPPGVLLPSDVPMINTSFLPVLLESFVKSHGELEELVLQVAITLAIAADVMRCRLIPLLRDYEEEKQLTLWNSSNYAILFSVDILMGTLADFVLLHSPEAPKDTLCSSYFPKYTAGIARSLLEVGKCRSLVHRLGFTSAQFYLLLSLPNGSDTRNENHSKCSPKNCGYFNVDRTTYHTRHTSDCVMCEDITIRELDLVALISREEVPLIRSTMDADGVVTITLTKMSIDVYYTAISHVWAGGLGNFESNWLPQCQLQAIHKDVCDVSARTDSLSFRDRRKSRGWLSSRTVCYYWMDTLCIPVNHDKERSQAINSMGRIYAGSSEILVLDPTLSQIGIEDEWRAADLLIAASPWMARSWPLQEAALAPRIYVKFADSIFKYYHRALGAENNFRSIPNQQRNRDFLSWIGGFHLGAKYSAIKECQKVQRYEPDNDFIKIWNLLSKRYDQLYVQHDSSSASVRERTRGKSYAQYRNTLHSSRNNWSLLRVELDVPIAWSSNLQTGKRASDETILDCITVESSCKILIQMGKSNSYG